MILKIHKISKADYKFKKNENYLLSNLQKKEISTLAQLRSETLAGKIEKKDTILMSKNKRLCTFRENNGISK